MMLIIQLMARYSRILSNIQNTAKYNFDYGFGMTTASIKHSSSLFCSGVNAHIGYISIYITNSW